jgi:hypothetical protein
MTARPIHSYELLDLAYELAGRDAGRVELSTTRLRRSISTSYYALFHQLIYSAARLLCGEEADAQSERNTVVRWISHTDVVALARAIRDSRQPIAAVLPSPSPELLGVVRALPTCRSSVSSPTTTTPST